MQIQVNVNATEATKTEIAKVQLHCRELNVASQLDIDFLTLRNLCGIPSSTVLDFLFIASIVYAVDKLIPRKTAQDNWTRELEVDLPVENIELWNRVRDKLQTTLSFLTGDYWSLNFYNLEHPLSRPRQNRVLQIPNLNANAVCLFSGGLDSLIGVINWLETNQTGNLLLASHYDPRVPGPLSDQNALLEVLQPIYPQRIKPLQVRVGQNPSGKEVTFRSRSILFIALGLYAACSIGPTTPLIIPENGTIALNVPLTPSRRGSCSTRTTHPFLLNSISNILGDIGVANSIHNPYAFKTKGECVEECLNQDALKEAVKRSRSCAKSGHTSSWINRGAKGCGRCMPCIYRRASLHKVGLDTEVYGRDICSGEVDLNSAKISAIDFRACANFLKQNPSRERIARMLLSNGKLYITHINEYADLVCRAMNEIRVLVRDKATNGVKQRCGINDQEVL